MAKQQWKRQHLKCAFQLKVLYSQNSFWNKCKFLFTMLHRGVQYISTNENYTSAIQTKCDCCECHFHQTLLCSLLIRLSCPEENFIFVMVERGSLIWYTEKNENFKSSYIAFHITCALWHSTVQYFVNSYASSFSFSVFIVIQCRSS